jgi:alpha-mannosidase
MKEYFPQDYSKMKEYVAAGRWFPAGSSVEEGDVNLPSAEGIFRQILYGNEYFRHEFGKASNEYMLPDCFGFPASLPSILSHAGVKGFSTQKLSANWQPAPQVGGPGSPEQTPEGIPFNVGVWTGPDGKSILAALNPGGYGSNVYTDLSKEPGPPPPWPELTSEQKDQLTPSQAAILQRPRPWEQDWVKRIDIDGKATGVFADYHYVGTGDIGGATQEYSVKLLEAIITQSETVLPSPPQPNFLHASTAASPAGPEVKVGWSGTRHRIRSRPDVQHHHPGDGIAHAPVPGRSGADQSLRRLAHFAGLSQALDHQEREPRQCRGRSFRRCRVVRRARLPATAPQRRLDARTGRSFS